MSATVPRATQTTVRNKPIRLALNKAIEQDRIGSVAELARILDINHETFRNCLGYKHQGKTVRTWIDRELAARVARELGVDPMDVGL